jgi:PRC-barrel domain
MVDTDDDCLRELEERYEGYEVYDNAGEKIGKVDDLFIDETDREEYIGVKMGLFGLSGKGSLRSGSRSAVRAANTR